MKRYFGFLTAAMLLIVFAGPGGAQTTAGIPPMLETQRPLAMPANQPEPKAPQEDLAKPVAPAAKPAKTGKAKGKKCVSSKANVVAQKKTTKTAKKKGATVKPRGKVAANN